jgi:AcrR family transcriptional regulator
MLEKIIEGCDKLFRRYGIKSLSMDDIARELGMSKKTLYLYFSDKNDLVHQTFGQILNSNELQCRLIKQAETNAIEELILISRNISQQMKGINPAVFYDLRKYHPESWQLFENHSHTFIFNQIKENLAKGVREGFYRSDVDENIISQLYISLIQTITNPQLFSNIDYDFGAVYQQLIKYHIHGISTKSGLEFYENKKS